MIHGNWKAREICGYQKFVTIGTDIYSLASQKKWC